MVHIRTLAGPVVWISEPSYPPKCKCCDFKFINVWTITLHGLNWGALNLELFADFVFRIWVNLVERTYPSFEICQRAWGHCLLPLRQAHCPPSLPKAWEECESQSPGSVASAQHHTHTRLTDYYLNNVFLHNVNMGYSWHLLGSLILRLSPTSYPGNG
jgi:hypothetical protein